MNQLTILTFRDAAVPVQKLARSSHQLDVQQAELYQSKYQIIYPPSFHTTCVFTKKNPLFFLFRTITLKSPKTLPFPGKQRVRKKAQVAKST